MATRIGDMAIYISANTYGLGRDLARASVMATSFAGGVSRQMMAAGRSITGLFRDIAGVAGGNLLSDGIKSAAGGIGGLVKSSLDLAGAAEVAAGQFETILGSAKEAATLMSDLRGFAANSPVSVADAQQQALRLLSAGVSREQVTPTIGRLSDLSMGDPNKLKDLVTAYSQVMTTGRLQGDEWNQIANIGTLGFKDLAKVLKVDEDQVKKLIEAGRVGFYDLQLAIKGATDEGGRFAGLGAKYAGTYLGKLDKVDDAWQDLKRAAGQALTEEWGLKDAADDVTSFTENLKGFVDVLRPAMRFVGDLGKGLAQLGAEGGRGFFAIADVTLGKLNQRFPETIRWIKDGVQSLKEFKLDPDGIERFAEKFGDGLADAIKRVQPYWDAFAKGIGTVLDKLGQVADWFDRPTNIHVRAALSVVNYSDLRKGDAAAARSQWEETRSKQLRDEYGLDMGSAYDLLSFQVLYNEAKAKKDAAEGGAAKYRELLSRGGVYDNDNNRWAVSDYSKAAADAAETMRRAAEMSAKIVARGDPSLTPAGVEAAKLKRQADREAEERWKAEQKVFDAAIAPPKPDFTPDAPKLDSRLSDLAGQLNDKFIDPLKKFADDLADLDKLKAAGRIDANVYALAVADLLKEVGGEAANRLPDAAELGSQQLATLVAQATAGQGPTSVPALLEQIRVQNAALIAEAQKIAANTGQAPVVATMPGN